MSLIGRRQERELLNDLLRSNEAEFLAVYGRRRVGKTFLVREHFKKRLTFELTGVRDGLLQEQLANFQHELKRRSNKDRERPRSWQEAFQQLAEHLRSRRSQKKQVIFLDELPWLAGPRSRFLPALDHFWNTVLSRDPRFILIICGSAASWMIAKVIQDKGGLHNRLTAPSMKLEPFTLGESSRYLQSRNIKLTKYDQLTLAMVMGGVPHYLKEAKPGQSAAQIIDRSCFQKTGLLRDEFRRLYSSLFEHFERHVDIVRELAEHPQGLTRSGITSTYASGGRLTDTLLELEEAGFISSHAPFGKKSKDTIYRLTDEYSLFYLKWIENKRTTGKGSFLKKLNTPGWNAWSGYALESLAHKHLPQIKHALGIAELDTTHCSWIHRSDKTWRHGAQIDLLLDRADNTINLFEIKFSRGPFTINKKYAGELRQKLETFRNVTGTKKNLFLNFLTTHGLNQNPYATELVAESIMTDTLFKIV